MEGLIEIDAVVKEILPNATFRVELYNGHEVLAGDRGQDAQVPHYIQVQMSHRITHRRRAGHRR